MDVLIITEEGKRSYEQNSPFTSSLVLKILATFWFFCCARIRAALFTKVCHIKRTYILFIKMKSVSWKQVINKKDGRQESVFFNTLFKHDIFFYKSFYFHKSNAFILAFLYRMFWMKNGQVFGCVSWSEVDRFWKTTSFYFLIQVNQCWRWYWSPV